jgi:hypothetical protein
MIDYTKGGRGKSAPYATSHVRVPLVLKPLVETISSTYKRLLSLNNLKLTDKFIRTIEDVITKTNQQQSKPVNEFISKEQAIQIANQILKQKKSAKISLGKLLTVIYDEEIIL